MCIRDRDFALNVAVSSIVNLTADTTIVEPAQEIPVPTVEVNAEDTNSGVQVTTEPAQ